MNEPTFDPTRRDVGWRSHSASNAKSWHDLDDEGNAICGQASVIAVTNAMLIDSPRAYPTSMIRKLRALPRCGHCVRHENKLNNQSRSLSRVERLEQEVRELREKLYDKEILS